MVLSPKVFFKNSWAFGQRNFSSQDFWQRIIRDKTNFIVKKKKKRISPKVIGDENKSMLESNPESMNQTLKNNNLKIYEPNFNK